MTYANMNPTCKVDINRPECQKWMVEVYAKCRDLFRTESLPMWWVNDTPAVYKADVQDMTVADCHRLKRELANEVAEPFASIVFRTHTCVSWSQLLFVFSGKSFAPSHSHSHTLALHHDTRTHHKGKREREMERKSDF